LVSYGFYYTVLERLFWIDLK